MMPTSIIVKSSRSTAHSPARRTLKTRNTTWARALATTLARAGVQPNAVSVASIGCAGAAAAAFALAGTAGLREAYVPGATGWIGAGLLAGAAACVQLRLLCNLLDGLLAVEEGLHRPDGDIYNELPDRLADVLILAGAGFGARALPHAVTLGWIAALLALLTAYVRTLGGSLGLPEPFLGPMAKQHRMFAITVAALASAPDVISSRPPAALRIGLAVIVTGSLVTVARRTRHLLREANAR